MQDFEELNTKFFTEVTKAVNALVDSKVAVHAHDKILDDQVDDFKERLVSLLSPLFLTFSSIRPQSMGTSLLSSKRMNTCKR
jgi:hypothetical protein